MEERVAILEIQVMDIREDLTTAEMNVSDLDEDVNFLFDEQVIQDERLLNLEETTSGMIGEIDLIEDNLEGEFVQLRLERGKARDNKIYTEKFTPDLRAATLALDFRVRVLEENERNSSVAELELRVDVLEVVVTGRYISVSLT